MKISEQGISLIKDFEGFRGTAYIPVPGDRLTIGYGTTKGVRPGQTISKSEADLLLRKDLVVYEDAVSAALHVPTNPYEFSAMVSLTYNIGIAGFRKSTVLKAHNRGDRQAASRAFSLWNKSSGKVYTGLTRRRADEAKLYLTSTPKVEKTESVVPQMVDKERSMALSQINIASTAAGGTAAVTAAAETVSAISSIKTGVATLSDWAIPILLIAVVVLCVYIVLQRNKQRKEGWA